MSKTIERDYYTVAEVAEILDVSHSTVWRWIRAGKLRAYRVGSRNLRIRPSDLNSLSESESDEREWESLTHAEKRERLLRPLSKEEQEEQRALYRKIVKNRVGRTIAPMTSDELVRLGRDREFWYGPDS